jgi:hypothetical protein
MQSAYVRSDKAAQSRVGAETVLLHMESGIYFGLDEVGTRVWELLETASTLQEIFERMDEEFEVNREQLNVDVQAFLQELLDAELIFVSEG